MSLPNQVEHVEKRHATQNKHSKASAESSGAPEVSNRSLSLRVPSSTYHLKEKISLGALMESDGQTLKRSGSGWKCCCPFHADRTPSFSIDPSDAYARCFGCGWKGDIFQYVKDRMGLSFCEAVALLDQRGSLHGTKSNATEHLRKQTDADFLFSQEDQKDIALFTGRLATEQWLAERVASSESWNPDTISRLAQEGHLGWAGDTLAFLYKTGYKLRQWPGRRFWWERGHAHLWRYEKIAQAREIWICEGETDAISLIDKGVETAANVAVVAAASATSFKPEFASYFVGKNALVCFDADDAGRNGAAKVHEILKPVVAELHDFNPKEVR